MLLVIKKTKIKAKNSGKIMAVGTHLKTWKPMGIAKL